MAVPMILAHGQGSTSTHPSLAQSGCGGLGDALAFVLATALCGLCSVRMGGAWPRATPLLALAAFALGLTIDPVQAAGPWCLMTSAAMSSMLIALPRPHSVPSAVVATALLGLGLAAVPTRLRSPGAEWVLGGALVVLLFVTGMALGRWLLRARHGPLAFVGVGWMAGLLAGLWMLARIAL